MAGTTGKKEEQETRSPVIERLSTLVESAESTKGQPTPIADLLARVDAVNALVADQKSAEESARGEGQISAGGALLVERLGEALPQITKALDVVERLSSALTPFRETVDRSEGDALVTAFQNLSKVPDMLTPADVTDGALLVTRWSESAPVKSAGGTRKVKEGEPTYSDLPFRVSYKCGTCGKTFSTRKHNVNSARNECIKHARNAHNALIGQGTSDFDQLTKALTDVMAGNVDGSEGGNWKVTKSA
jgi:hypothetical protein